MPDHIPMLGRTFGSWTVISGPYKWHWECRCVCGTLQKVDGYTLRKGTSSSCRSCSHKEHGLSKSRAYVTWVGMLHRCENPTCESYPDYGARGIAVCERWRDFRNFFADMGERPEGHEIDRIDNDGNYEPGNCHWVTAEVNGRNKRNNVIVEYGGRAVTLIEASELSGIHYETLRTRLARGTPLFQPVKQINHPRHH